MAASLGWHFTSENAEVSFATQEYEGDDLRQFLTRLALLEPAESLPQLEDLQLSAGYNIVVTSRPRGAIPTALWTTSYFVFIGGRDEENTR